MARGSVDNERIRQLIRKIEKEVYNKKPGIWQRFFKWLTR